MRIINHFRENKENVESDWMADQTWIENLHSPIVRIGGEPFEGRWKENGWWRHSIVADPRRSFVEAVWSTEFPEVILSIGDPLFVFGAVLVDLGFGLTRPSVAEQVAFHTMFPARAVDLQSGWGLERARFSQRQKGIPRVVNNPFFYRDDQASDKRLLDIASDDGCTYAVDMSVEIPTAEVLAHEIALVSHIQDGEDAIVAAEREILRQVNEVL